MNSTEGRCFRTEMYLACRHVCVAALFSLELLQVGAVKGLSYISISMGVVLGRRRHDTLSVGSVFPYTPAPYAVLYLLLNTTH